MFLKLKAELECFSSAFSLQSVKKSRFQAWEKGKGLWRCLPILLSFRKGTGSGSWGYSEMDLVALYCEFPDTRHFPPLQRNVAEEKCVLEKPVWGCMTSNVLFKSEILWCMKLALWIQIMQFLPFKPYFTTVWWYASCHWIMLSPENTCLCKPHISWALLFQQSIYKISLDTAIKRFPPHLVTLHPLNPLGFLFQCF